MFWSTVLSLSGSSVHLFPASLCVYFFLILSLPQSSQSLEPFKDAAHLSIYHPPMCASHPSTYPPIHLSIHPSIIPPSLHPSIIDPSSSMYLPVHLSIHYPLIHPLAHLLTYPSIYATAHPPSYPLIYNSSIIHTYIHVPCIQTFTHSHLSIIHPSCTHSSTHACIHLS